MSLSLDTPQGIANALGYLQHHLHELTERQNVSENNINTTLVALTTQLQQLTQLVANSPPLPISNTPPPPVPSSLASPPSAPTARRMHPKLSCPPDFGREHHNGRAFLNSCSLYIYLAPEQFHDEEERILWAFMFFKSGHAAKWSENMFCQEADTGVFPSEPGETLSNNSGFTSSQLTRKQMQSMLWKAPPITKEAGRWTTIWTTSRPWSPTQVTQIPGC